MMPDKLNSKIKESLRDSESPFDPSGWDRLERNLDAKATTTPTKFKMNWKYSLNTVLVVAAASALIAGAVKLTDYLSTLPEDPRIESKPNVITEQKKPDPVTTVVKDAETTPNKEVVVQQFFPTQVYNIQYPLYNGMKYTGASNDQVAMENFNPEGEFSEQVKNRPLLTNPLVRGYVLGESPVNNNQHPVVMKQGGSELKLTPEEMRLFSDPSLLNSRRDLIFPDQIDSKQGYIFTSKEADSMKKIAYFQDHPDLKPQILNTTKEQEEKTDSSNDSSDKNADNNKPPKKKEIKDTTTPDNKTGGNNKPKVDGKKKQADKPKDGGMKKDPLDPYNN